MTFRTRREPQNYWNALRELLKGLVRWPLHWSLNPRYARAMRGDYTVLGVQQPGNLRADIDALIRVLRSVEANSFMHLIWDRDGLAWDFDDLNRNPPHYAQPHWPNGWEDFELMASRFHANGLSLWAYLPHRGEGHEPWPEDYRYDLWATRIATLAQQHPNVKGMVIDDFHNALNDFPVSTVEAISNAAKTLYPAFKFYAVTYYTTYTNLLDHVRNGVLDGIVFPYVYRYVNGVRVADLERTELLRDQISEIRTWLDTNSPLDAAGRRKHVDLVVMIYASGHSEAPTVLTSNYVRECLRIAKNAIWDGLADGVVTYVLPKNDQSYLQAVRDVYANW